MMLESCGEHGRDAARVELDDELYYRNAKGKWFVVEVPGATAYANRLKPREFLALVEEGDAVHAGQVLAELAPSIPVRCETVGGARLDSDVPSLLPLAFDAERLP